MKKIFLSFLLVFILGCATSYSTQVPANLVTSTVPSFPKCLNSSATNVQTAINQLDSCTGGTPSSGITFTDGVNTVSSATSLNVTGGVIGGTTPIATLTISTTPGGVPNQFQINNSGNFGGGNMYSVGGNVGVNNNSPGAQLDVTGTARMTGFNLSTSPTTGYVLTSDSVGTGTWQLNKGNPAGNQGQYQYNGGSGNFAAGNMLFTNGTNVGIGTTIPNKLFCVGTSNSGGSSTKNGFCVDPSGNIVGLGGQDSNINAVTIDLTNQAGPINIGNNSGAAGSFTPSVNIHTGSTTGYITLSPGANVEALRATAAGNIGIGTSTPAAPLDVHGIVNGYDFHTPNQAGGVVSAQGYTLDPTGIGPLMYLTASRNVGINTAMPARLFEIAAADPNITLTTASAPSMGILNQNTTNGNVAEFAFSTIDTNGSQVLGAKMAGVFTSHAPSAVSTDIVWLSKNAGTTAEKMRMTSSGNLGIGSSVPGENLDVNGTIRSTGLILSTNPASGYVLTSNNIGQGTWEPSSSGVPTSGTNMLFGNGSGGFTNATTTAVSGGNIGIGTTTALNNTLTIQGGITVQGNNSNPFTVSGVNVGIGSANPGAALDVTGTTRTTGLTLTGNGAANGYVMVGNSVGIGTWMPVSTLGAGGTAAGGLNAVQYNNPVGTFSGTENLFSFNGTNVGIGTNSAATASIVIVKNGSSKLVNASSAAGSNGNYFTIDNSGNVGIGTSVPYQTLEIGNQKLNINSNGNIGIGTLIPNNSIIVATGNVGIATAFPGTPLDVTGTVRDTGEIVNGNVGIGTSANQTALSVMNGNVGVGTYAPTALFQVIGSGVMTVTNQVGVGTNAPTGALEVENGNVGIGTWVQPDSLSVKGGIAFSGNFAGGITGNVGIGTAVVTAGTCDSACNTASKRCLFGLTIPVTGFEPCSASITGDCVCLPAT